MNRVEDHRYADDICSVVFAKNQFSFTHDGKSDKLPNNENARVSMEVAKEILRKGPVEITSTHYHATYVQPNWNKVFTYDGRHGKHLFYTNETPYK